MLPLEERAWSVLKEGRVDVALLVGSLPCGLGRAFVSVEMRRWGSLWNVSPPEEFVVYAALRLRLGFIPASDSTPIQ